MSTANSIAMFARKIQEHTGILAAKIEEHSMETPCLEVTDNTNFEVVEFLENLSIQKDMAFFSGHTEDYVSDSSRHSEEDMTSEITDSELEEQIASHVNLAKSFRQFGGEKRVQRLLGEGKLVDLLMWKKKKKSAIFLSLGTVIWVLFEWFEYHFVTLSCLVILAYMVAVIFYNDVATSISGFPLPPIPRINVPEEAIFNVASVIRAEANRFSDFIYEVSSDVSSVRQAKRFILVVACISVVSVISSWCNFLTLLYSCSVAAFTVPKLYERYEDEIDRLLNNATLEIKKWYSQISGKIDGVRDNAKLAITKRYIQILVKIDQVRQIAREEMGKLYLQISERVRAEMKRQYEWVVDKAMNKQYRLFDNRLLTKILRSRVKTE